MKIHGVKLNKKNFWIPFLVSSVLSFLIFLFTLAIFFSDSWSIYKIGLIFLFLLPSSPLLFGLISIPAFFIIKRLLSNNPKKLFYFEFPVLMVIYLAALIVNDFIGLMMGGPDGMTLSDILAFIVPQAIFIIIWIILLTISLYFYYKKMSLLNLSPIKSQPVKSNISIKSFWIPFLISSILSFPILLFGGSFVSYLSKKMIVGEVPYSQYLSFNLNPLILIFTIFLVLIPSFFIIKRLLSNNPKKLFYFELPILVLIYSFFKNFFVFVPFIFGEFMGVPILLTLIALLSVPIFIIIWISLLTISLYFYYKRNNFFQKLKNRPSKNL